MTSSERNDTHQPWCPLQVLESIVELTRTLCTSQTSVSNSWVNSSRNLCIAFHSLLNTRVIPDSLRTKLLLLKRLRKIIHPNMKEVKALFNLWEAITGDTAGTKFQHGGEEKIEIIDLCSLGNAKAAENMNPVKQSEVEWRIRRKVRELSPRRRFSSF